MKPRRSVDEWRRTVYRHPGLKDGTRVYLLWLADHMRTDRTVSVPRATAARALGKSERRIDDRNADARRAGLLDTVVHGQKGVTAVYAGLFPEPFSASKSSVLNSARNVALKPGSARQTGVAPVVSQPPELSPRGPVPYERRSKDEVSMRFGVNVRKTAAADWDQEQSA